MRSPLLVVALFTVLSACGSSRSGSDAGTQQDAGAEADGGCGACAGRCVLGRCLVALDAKGASAHAIDATSVYWLDFAGQRVMKAPLAGGAPVVLATNQLQPGAIAVDAHDVYWTLLGPNGSVAKVPLSGGMPTTLAAGQAFPRDVASDGTTVYWTCKSGSVMKVAAAGGAPTAIATQQDGPEALALGSADVYWTNATGGTVMTAPKSGGAPVVIASGQSQPEGIATQGSNLYWSNSGDGTLMKVTTPPNTPSPLYTDAATPPHRLAVDAAYVYFTSLGYVAPVMKVPITGGAATLLAPDQASPETIRVDQGSVSWVSSSEGVLVLTPK